MRQLLCLLLIAAALLPPVACGQEFADELAELRSRLDAVERENEELRVATIERREANEKVDYRLYLNADEDAAGSTTLEERVKAIEEDLEKEAKEAAKKKEKDAPKPTMTWSGRIHADYWAFPHTSPGANAFENGDSDVSVQDRFLFRRMRWGVQGNIPDLMLYRMEIEFPVPNNPQMKDVFIGWEELPLLQTLLVGNQKRPYGLDHINSSRYNVFLERPAIIEAFNQDARRFGIQSWGVSEDEEYNWRFGAFMMQDVQNLGIAMATPVNEDYQAELAGRFANTLWYDELTDGRSFGHWAISGSYASPDGNTGGNPFSSTNPSAARFQTRPEARTTSRWLDTGVIAGTQDYELLGLEGLVNLGPLQAVGEYQHVWLQRDAAGPDLEFHGGYGYVSYFLTGESMAWDRKTGQLARVTPFENFFHVRDSEGCICNGWGAWQIALRYSVADLTDEDIGGGVSNEWTAGLNWYWNPYARMQFNYIWGEIDDRFPAVDGQTAANFSILGTRFMVDF